MESARKPSARRGLPPWLLAIILSILLVGASVAITELSPPAGSDGLALRWLRILAGHPVRSLLALALLVWSLAPRTAPLSEPPQT